VSVTVTAWVWLLVGRALLAGAPQGGQDVLEARWRVLMMQPDPAAAADQIASVLRACGPDPARLKRLIANDSAYRRYPGGWLGRKTSVTDGDTRYDVQFMVRVPARYDPARAYPLLLAAHGQGGSARSIGYMMERLLGPAVEDYVICAPTMPGPTGYNARAYQEQAYLRPLRWTRQHLNIDDERIFVAGYSMGGHGAWHLATMFPHLFAAAVPMAGVPAFEGGIATTTAYLENLSNLPVWAIWGQLDRRAPGTLGNVDFCRMAAARLRQLGNRNFKGTEWPGKGHGGCWPAPAEFRRFLAAHKRRAAPVKVTYCFHCDRHRQGYYLRALELARPAVDFSCRPRRRPRIRLRPGQRPTTQMVIDAWRKYYARLLFRMRAELDPAGNTLSINTAGIRSVRVYLVEGMFDLHRAVRLRLNGRQWQGRVTSSAECILRHYAATRDAAAIVLNEIDIDATGKATVRYR